MSAARPAIGSWRSSGSRGRLGAALFVAPPRRKTRPTKASERRRKQTKRRRGESQARPAAAEHRSRRLTPPATCSSRMRWYIDGMNVIGTRPDGWWRDRDAAMLHLVDLLENWAAAEGEDVVVVFERPARAAAALDRDRDRDRPQAQGRRRRRRDRPAAARASRSPRLVRVVTSDRWLTDRAQRGRRGGPRRRHVPVAARAVLIASRAPAPARDVPGATGSRACHNQWYGRPANPGRAAPAARSGAAAGARDPRLEGHPRARRPRRPATPAAAAQPDPDRAGGSSASSSRCWCSTSCSPLVAVAQLAGPHPLQPELHRTGQGRQRPRHRLQERLDHRSFQEGGHVPGRLERRKPTTNFETQVPSFANNRQLSALLRRARRRSDAQNPNSGPSILVRSWSASARRCCSCC